MSNNKEINRIKNDLFLIEHAWEYVRGVSARTCNDGTFIGDIQILHKSFSEIEDNLIGQLNDLDPDWNK